MFRSSSIWFAFLAALLWLSASGGPAHAQEGTSAQATAALTEASKYLDEGIPVKAIDAINGVLKSGKISSDLAAKALLLRARAQEKLGKYAYALADYNQALWMEGLSSSDKGEAEAGRARIMAKLGVDENPSKTAAPAQPAQPKRAASKTRVGVDRGANVQTSPSEERTGGIFGGLFGSSETSPSQQTAEPAPPPKPAPRAAAQPVNVAASTRTANVSDDSTANDAGAPAGEPTGDFAIQFAALLSEDSAIYEVERIGKRYSEWLGGRTPSIRIRPTAEGGTLYKIIAEPYERGEGVATCELLKTKGVSCMLISR
jgi:hypothetical protein